MLDRIEHTTRTPHGRTTFAQWPDGRVEIVTFIPAGAPDPVFPDTIAMPSREPSSRASNCNDPDSECATRRLLSAIMRLGKGSLALSRLGLSKLGLRDDIAPDEVMDARWGTCATCPKNTRGWCEECACNLPAKVMLTKEQCPLSKW